MSSGGKGAAPDWLTRGPYAHRGLHSPGLPENSIAASGAAIARGFGIECDVQLSADGVPMVFHDWDAERLCGHPNAIASMKSDDIEQLGLLGTEQRPARLASFLSEVDARAALLIELKSKPTLSPLLICEAVARAVAGYSGHCAIMSFDPRVPQWFAQHAPEISRGLVGTDSYPNGFEHVWRDPDIIALAQPHFVALDRRDLARPEAAQWRDAGGALLSWTIRTKAEWNTASALADALIAEGEALA
ncbi:MAG: glycerophosphodiester phosphodiesterase family protein [Pseudomonadota bacterium]